MLNFKEKITEDFFFHLFTSQLHFALYMIIKHNCIKIQLMSTINDMFSVCPDI